MRRALWPVLAAAGVAAEVAGFGFDDRSKWIPDLVTGWVLAGCGLVAWDRRPRSPVGPLLGAPGGVWVVGEVSAALVYAYRGPLLHCTLSFPSGRPRGRGQALAVAGAYLAAAIAPVWRSETLTIVLSVAFVAVAAAHRRGTVGRERRERTYALRATAAVAVLLAGTAIFRLAVRPVSATDARVLALEAALALPATMLGRGLLREPWARPVPPDLGVELAETRFGSVRDRLARALGDPTLEGGFRVGEGGGYVDAAGRAMALPRP